jgi:hypothetical protein
MDKTVTQVDRDAVLQMINRAFRNKKVKISTECFNDMAASMAAHRLTQITALENPTPEMVEDVAIALAEAEGEQWCADNANETLNGNSPADMRFSYRESAQTALTAAAAHLKGQV